MNMLCIIFAAPIIECTVVIETFKMELKKGSKFE